MSTGKEFFQRIATDAGLDLKNEQLAALLSNPELEKITVDTVIENIIRTNLMNVNAAKNNPSLQEYFEETLRPKFMKSTAETLNGFDTHMLRMAEEHGLDEESVKEIKRQEKTGAKLEALNKKLKESYEKKGTGNVSAKVEEERRQLNEKIRQLEAEKTTLNSDWEKKYNNELTGFTLNSVLSGYKYGLPKEIPQDVVLETARNLVNRKLAEGKMRANYNPEQKGLELLTDAGTKAYVNNQEISFKDFTDKVLAEGNLLEVTGTPAPLQTQRQTQQQQLAPSANNKEYQDYYKGLVAELKNQE